MFRNLGWAAFLALVFLLVTTVSGAALANGAGPTYACFSPDNALAVGHLGADDPSVRLGFEAGGCLALAPGVPVSDVERFGTLWRFRALGAKPYLYAADWAAGFQPVRPPLPGFERYLAITAWLMERGHNFIRCYDDSNELAGRFADFDRRWLAYNGRPATKAGMMYVIYFGDTQYKLAMEREQLMSEAASLESRCQPYQQINLDRDFMVFLRTSARR